MVFFSNSKAEVKKALKVIQRASKGDFEVRIQNIKASGDLKELLYGIN